MLKNDSKRSLLRREMRTRRRALSPLQQTRAARNIFLQLRKLPGFRFAKRLAFYIAIDGEINPALLIKLAQKQGKQCYLPVIRKDGQDKLLFLRYKPSSNLYKNHYTLSEPAVQKCKTVPAWSLNTVMVPLVAFDSDGSRLGMGKGYYDRTFEFLKTFGRSKPKLLGLAHECQRVEKLQVASWDVPLDGIITDQQFYQTNMRQISHDTR